MSEGAPGSITIPEIVALTSQVAVQNSQLRRILELVEKHERAIYGNGGDGLKIEVERLKIAVQEIREQRKEEAGTLKQILVPVLQNLLTAAIGAIAAVAYMSNAAR